MSAKFFRGGNMIADGREIDGYNPTPDRNNFDLSHRNLFTAYIGDLNLCLAEEVLPDDHWNIGQMVYTKLQPLVNPIFDNLDTSVHHFYVPLSQVEPNIDKWFSGGANGNYSKNRVTIDFENAAANDEKDADLLALLSGKGSLIDNIGYGTCVKTHPTTGVMTNVGYLGEVGGDSPYILVAPLLAYRYIYNEYYRHEELEADRFAEPSEGWKYALAQYRLADGTYNRGNFPYGAFLKWIMQDMELASDTLDALGWSTDNLETRENRITPEESNESLIWRVDAYKNPVYDACYWLIATRSVDIAAMIKAQQENQSKTDPYLYTWIMSRLQQRDYFTNALPFVQRGSTTASIQSIVKSPITANGGLLVSGGNTLVKATATRYASTTSGGSVTQQFTALSPVAGTATELSTSVTMDDIRKVSALTRFLEVNAKAGYRFYEYIYAHFGIEDKFDKLKRPIYVGGCKGEVEIAQITTTSETNEGSVGSWAANGQAHAQGNAEFSADEHGYVIGIYSCLPKNTYTNIHRKWLDKYGDRTLIYTPEFAHMTEQPILSYELNGEGSNTGQRYLNSGNLDPSHPVDETIFGYIPRYEEYRSIPSVNHGEFKDGDTRTYHMSRLFDSRVRNSMDFQHVIANQENLNRIFQLDYQQFPQLLIECDYGISADRPIPTNGNAGYLM